MDTLNRTRDLWDELLCCRAPIVLYGTGNGADKILAVFAQKGIPCHGVFASDGFVRSRTFHGMPVLSYDGALERFGPDMVIVIAFASDRPEVMARMEDLALRHTVYLPAVPVAGSLWETDGQGGVFDAAYYRRHEAQIRTVSSFFLDEISQKCYNDIIDYRLSGDLFYLKRQMHTLSDRYAILHSETVRTAVDLGAYTGDTVTQLRCYAPALRQVIAAEPDRRSFAALTRCAAKTDIPSLLLYPRAAWCCRTTLPFAAKASRGSANGAAGKTVSVTADTPDSMIGNFCPEYIKYDVEGAERAAILGSIRTIRRYRPSLLVSLYHRTEDLFTLPAILRQICPSYRFYLRRGQAYPDWEIQLLAIAE